MDTDRSKNRPTNDKVAETVSAYTALQTQVSQVSYRNAEAVEAYLVAHPEIEPFLVKAWPALVQCFGQHVEIVLEVMFYPDEAAEANLVGWIQSVDDVQAGLSKLERFEDEWFLDHMAEVEHSFNFNLENK